jgi:hypothetical protein
MTGNLVSCTFLALGIVGALDTQLQETATLTIFTVHPITALVWLLIGLVGVAMSVGPRSAQVFLLGAGILLGAWGILCLVLGDATSDVFARDTSLIVLLLVYSAISLAVALVPPIPRLHRVLE